MATGPATVLNTQTSAYIDYDTREAIPIIHNCDEAPSEP